MRSFKVLKAETHAMQGLRVSPFPGGERHPAPTCSLTDKGLALGLRRPSAGRTPAAEASEHGVAACTRSKPIVKRHATRDALLYRRP